MDHEGIESLAERGELSSAKVEWNWGLYKNELCRVCLEVGKVRDSGREAQKTGGNGGDLDSER